MAELKRWMEEKTVSRDQSPDDTSDPYGEEDATDTGFEVEPSSTGAATDLMADPAFWYGFDANFQSPKNELSAQGSNTVQLGASSSVFDKDTLMTTTRRLDTAECPTAPEVRSLRCVDFQGY